MTPLQDLDAVYVDISDTEKVLVKYITLDGQEKEITHPSSDYALLTIEETLEYMAWEEKLLKENMGLPKKNS